MKVQFEDLLKRISPTLKRIAHKLNGRFSFFDDDDLFQEALVYLWVLFQKGVLDDKTDSYILQGLYFHLKNYLRKSIAKANLVSLSEFVDGDETTLEEAVSLDGAALNDSLDHAILLESIRSACLTEREEEVLRLCLEGLTVREIGKALCVSHVMVIKIKKRLRSKLAFLKTSHTPDF